MKPRLQVSKTAIGLIKQFEGYRRSAAQLADGRWTIGYGHTLTAREGASVNEADASALLLYDLLGVAGAVNDLTFTPLTQNQFDALVCLAFNIGLPEFRTSNVLSLINEGALLQAAYALEAWRKAEFEGGEIVVDGLIRRRSAEKTLFLTPTAGFVAIPSAVVKPRMDPDAIFARVIDVATSMDGVTAEAVAAPTWVLAALTPEPALVTPTPVVAAPTPAPEALYQIPGYGAVKEAAAPAADPWANLTISQLSLIGIGGLGLLGTSFALAMHGSHAAGSGKTLAYGLAAAAVLAGAMAAFAAIYQVLNRLDREA